MFISRFVLCGNVYWHVFVLPMFSERVNDPTSPAIGDPTKLSAGIIKERWWEDPVHHH